MLNDFQSELNEEEEVEDANQNSAKMTHAVRVALKLLFSDWPVHLHVHFKLGNKSKQIPQQMSF